MRGKKINTIAAASLILCLGLAGCGTQAASTGEGAAQVMGAGESISPEQAGMTQEKFKPADFGWKKQDKYEFPFLGVSLTLSSALLDSMDAKEVIMRDEQMLDDQGKLKYALLSWSPLTQEQKEAEVEKMGDGYINWVNALKQAGTFGMYAASMNEDEIAAVTKCSQQTLIGKSSDGAYQYYLSTNPEADTKLTEEIQKTNVQIQDIEEMPANGYALTEKGQGAMGDVASISPLNVKTISGEPFTSQELEKYDLTMVNVFATWCTACIQEIPDIEKLHQEMKDKGVNVVGVVTDTMDDAGENAQAIEKAKTIAEKTKATYPFLIPDKGYLNGRLVGIQALPETFFVDKKGNIVGKTYSGSHSYEDWKKIVEQELEDLKKNQ